MNGQQTLRLEVKEEMLLRLLKTGQVCAADFHCLDCESKNCLLRLCLGSCTNGKGCRDRAETNICRFKPDHDAYPTGSGSRFCDYNTI